MKQKLTETEEEIMQHIWALGECTVRQIMEAMNAADRPHSTVSSVVRILEKKGYVDHKAYGRTHVYYPIVAKDGYVEQHLEEMEEDYFSGSTKNLVSFLVEKEKLTPEDLEEMMALINKSSKS
jgi:predicted transcriptional regulator